MLFLLEALYGVAAEMGRHTVLTATTRIISEVTEVMGNIMSMGRIDWMYWLIRKIYEEWGCHDLLQQVNTLKVQLKEAEKYYNLLKQAEEKLSRRTWIMPRPLRFFKVLMPRNSLSAGLHSIYRFGTLLISFLNVRGPHAHPLYFIWSLMKKRTFSNSVHFIVFLWLAPELLPSRNRPWT